MIFCMAGMRSVLFILPSILIALGNNWGVNDLPSWDTALQNSSFPLKIKCYQLGLYTILVKVFQVYLIYYILGIFLTKNFLHLFDLTKINCSIYLIVKSLFHIIEMCKIKYFICDPVSVTKKLRPFQAKIKYQCAHNSVSYL